MKKIINRPEDYTDDMLRGIYAAHPDEVCCCGDNLRCYRTVKKTPGKVAIVTGGGTGHLPLFLGYVGDGMLDGCAVGGVFQSPSAGQILEVTKNVDAGAGVLYLYGNYTGDIMNFDMSAEMCEIEDIETRSIVGSDDVYSASPENAQVRRGVAGIFFMYKCAGAKAVDMATLDEVLATAQKVKDRTRSVGFAFSPCIIPEVGKANFSLGENEMAMGMGIHGEPGVWNGPVITANEIAKQCVGALLADMPVESKDEVSILINGLGATSLEELYILNSAVNRILSDKGIRVYRTFVGEYATSMEMSGASISLLHMDDELKPLLDAPAHTPFYTQI